MKKFDLNIESILVEWEVHHALRELIANALDEQKLSSTSDIKIFRDDDCRWHIRDYGRGITYEHFTQNENEEKLNAESVIGKFGIGLKDALATFDRKSVAVKIISKHGEFTIGKSTKIGFDEITTLHVYINPAQDTSFMGTDIVLTNIKDIDIEKAKEMFLIFSGEEEIEKSDYGSVLRKSNNEGNIYINGVRVAREDNFLFSYNITSLNAAIKRALNRERTNVGRAAYSDRIKSILLSCNSWDIASELIKDLDNYSFGKKHDELNWIDVQEHATKILSRVDRVVFVTSSDIEKSSDVIEEARETGHKLVVIPEVLKEKIHGSSAETTTLVTAREIEEKPQLIDTLKESGHNVIVVPEYVKEKAESINKDSDSMVTDFSYYVSKRNKNFEFDFIDSSQLNPLEKGNYCLCGELLSAISSVMGSKSCKIENIFISETMQRDEYTFKPVDGLYQDLENRIIIKRSILLDRKKFIGTVLHEIAHFISNSSDATRPFEDELTKFLGIFGEKAISKN